MSASYVCAQNYAIFVYSYIHYISHISTVTRYHFGSQQRNIAWIRSTAFLHVVEQSYIGSARIMEYGDKYHLHNEVFVCKEELIKQ